MSSGRAVMKFVVALATVMITLVVPGVILQRAGVTNAGVVSLAGLAVVIAAATLGWRVGALTGLGVTAGVVLADAVAGSWLAATAIMVVASVALGLSASRGWQRGVLLAPIAVAFAVAEPPSQSWAGDHPLLLIGIVTAAASVWAVLVTWTLSRGRAPASPTPEAGRRAWGYALMLGIAAAITTPIAVVSGWGHAGSWLIMTPLIVIQPTLNDAVAKSLRRATGTGVGVVVALLIGLLIPETWVLYLLGAAFAGLALYAMRQKWDYSVFAAAVTVGIVLLEGTSTSVSNTAWWRLVATFLGVGIAVAITAGVSPLYRRAEHQASLAGDAT